jgi:hypothetical protein
MKNFLEATDIKPTLKLDVVITLDPVEGGICILLINDTVIHDGLLSGPKVITHRVFNDSPIKIKVIFTRKHPEAVKINVSIDNLSIIPLYQHMAEPATNYIDFNGEWTLTIPKFYPWYHRVTGQGWIA